MTPDPHLLPDGSTSWGPDVRAENAGPGGCVPWEQHQELEAEVERLKRVAQSNLDFAWKAEAERDRLQKALRGAEPWVPAGTSVFVDVRAALEGGLK